MTPSEPAISVVVPTFERRDVVLASLEGFERQSTVRSFEVVVVVDGSTDGTSEALESRAWSFPLRVLEQANAGASVARNTGAAHALAPVLLFLDDDMEPDPGAIDAHLSAHKKGADVVVGAMPLHPDSPSTILTAGVGRWADKLASRCSAPGYTMTVDDVFTGHLSVRTSLFAALGGFSTRFTANGAFGNEDVDLAQRLIDVGASITFRPDAVARQRFIVSARQHLRRGEDLGAADMALLRAHPHLDDDRRVASLRNAPERVLPRIVLSAPRLSARLLRSVELIVSWLVDRGASGRVVRKALNGLHDARYWRGVWSAGGPMDGAAAGVLCWHALEDLSDDPILRLYGVPPMVLAEQLATLKAAGWAALTPDEVLRLVRDHAHVPRRSFMATFDDCYMDLAGDGLAVLESAGLPAAAFVVTQRVGDLNRWDASLGRRTLPLATWDQLGRLQRSGVELGAHSRTHPELTRLDDERLRSEVAGSADDLRARGYVARMFAYPYGDHDRRVQHAAATAGFELAFTITPGLARAGCDPHGVRRLEIYPDERKQLLLRKVALGGRWPVLWTPWRRKSALLLRFARRARRALRRKIKRLLRG